MVGDRVELFFILAAEVFENCYLSVAIAPFSEAIADNVWSMLVAAEDEEFGVWVEGGTEMGWVSATKADGFNFCAGPTEARSGQSEGGKGGDYLHFWSGNRSE